MTIDIEDRSLLLDRVIAQESRADPYDLWAALREEPVSWQQGDRWAVTGYPEARAIIDDPRISVSVPGAGSAMFLVLDPPRHDVMRAAVMRHFGPPHKPGFVQSMTQRIVDAANRSFDAVAGQREMDLVSALAYPVPVSIICAVLGVPPEDEPQFSLWVEQLSKLAEPSALTPEDMGPVQRAQEEAESYLAQLISDKRAHPQDDLLSGLVTDGELSDDEIIQNAKILLLAGHETTVHSINNGVLMMLRRPELMEALQERPPLIAGAFEEMLRLDPPVQFRSRVAVAEIEIGGKTIPSGNEIVIGYAAANRDPRQFTDPDQFVLGREDNQHLSFNAGIHYCFGAPLARLESRIALDLFLRRVRAPRLVEDPPPYRPSALLRGPAELRIGFDEILAADAAAPGAP